MKIPVSVPKTSMDSTGDLYHYQRKFYRAFSKEQAINFVKPIMECGLIEELISKDLLVSTSYSEDEIEGYDLILEQPELDPVTYPYEWSFSMIKDVALAFIELSETAHKYGYHLKDCHPFNFVFHNCKPYWVDFGSFVKSDDEFYGFFALSEFVKQYYFVLRLWSNMSEFFARAVTGITSSYYYLNYSDFYKFTVPGFKLLPEKLQHVIGTFFEKYYNLHGIGYNGIELRKKSSFVTFFAKILNRIFISTPPEKHFCKWRKKILKMKSPKRYSQWKDYHDSLNGKIYSYSRFNKIIEVLKELECDSVLELAGNAGAFSLLLHKTNICERIICTDLDCGAIDKLYLKIKQQELKGLSAVIMDMIFPITTTIGKDPRERFKSEAVLALAVTHHLILSYNWKLHDILKFIGAYSSKYVLVEFMPKGLWVEGASVSIPDWYTIDWFRNEFSSQFELLQEIKLEVNRILFVGKVQN
jgi:hypothetical protein